MKTVSYFIGKGFTGKEKGLYLWRSEGASMSPIARFLTPEAVEQFAKEMKFPLSANINKHIKEQKVMRNKCEQ
jgi:hypothetical protein